MVPGFGTRKRSRTQDPSPTSRTSKFISTTCALPFFLCGSPACCCVAAIICNVLSKGQDDHEAVSLVEITCVADLPREYKLIEPVAFLVYPEASHSKACTQYRSLQGALTTTFRY